MIEFDHPIVVRTLVATEEGWQLSYLSIGCIRCGDSIDGGHFHDVLDDDGAVSRVCPGCTTREDTVVVYERSRR